MPSWHADGDGDEFNVAIIPVPLHAFKRLKVGLIKTHVRLPRALVGMQAGDWRRVLHQNGLQALNARRTGREHPTLPMISKHAAETASSRGAPAAQTYLMVSMGIRTGHFLFIITQMSVSIIIGISLVMVGLVLLGHLSYQTHKAENEGDMTDDPENPDKCQRQKRVNDCPVPLCVFQISAVANHETWIVAFLLGGSAVLVVSLLAGS